MGEPSGLSASDERLIGRLIADVEHIQSAVDNLERFFQAKAGNLERKSDETLGVINGVKSDVAAHRVEMQPIKQAFDDRNALWATAKQESIRTVVDGLYKLIMLGLTGTVGYLLLTGRGGGIVG